MESLELKDLHLSLKELRDIIAFLACKRGVNNYEYMSNDELLLAIKKSKNLTSKKLLKNPKRKITENLTSEKPLRNPKRKITENLTSEKPLKNPKRKITENLTSEKPLKNPKRKITETLTPKTTLQNPKRKITENLTSEKPLKNPKRKITEHLTPQTTLKNPKRKITENLTSKNNQPQKINSKNKERIDVIREELKELGYKLSKGELKEIKKNLYKIENKKGLLE